MDLFTKKKKKKQKKQKKERKKERKKEKNTTIHQFHVLKGVALGTTRLPEKGRREDFRHLHLRL